MATETLNVGGVATKGSWTGTDADIFEAIAGADDTGLRNQVSEGDGLLLDLEDSARGDGDTITNVSIVARGQRGANAGDNFTVQIYIGGVAQGSPVSFGTLTASWSTSGTLNDAGWNSDWTAAQLDGMQVEVVPTQGGMPENVDVYVDCFDVVITYTAAATDYSLTADGGSYDLSGTDANLEYHSVVDAAGGAYALAGGDANLEYHQLFAAEGGSYAVAGQDATLGIGFVMAADAGAYALAGQAAGLLHAALIDALAGAYALAGQDANLEYHSVLSAVAGSYEWGGVVFPDWALSFDGSNDHVALASQPDLTGGFTFEAWVTDEDTVRSDTKSIFNNNQFFLRRGNTGDGSDLEAFVRLSDLSNEPRSDTSIVLPVGVRTHVAATWDGTTLTVWQNGVPYDPRTRSGSLDPVTVEARIGRGQLSSVDGNPWKGTIDEGRIWNVARSQLEIQANMNRSLAGNEAGLVGYWPLNDGSGGTATDEAGSNDGTITGASWVPGLLSTHLLFDPVLAANAGAYAVAGAIAGLDFDSVISAQAGSYIVTGPDATLRIDFALTADGGSYAVTGASVTLLYATDLHRAESIMRAVVVALTGLTTTGANVFRGRAYEVQAGEVPALLVWMGVDQVAAVHGHDQVDSVLTVNIDAAVREVSAQVDTRLNLIREEVTSALAADHTLGLAYVRGAQEIGADEPEIAGEGDAPVARQRLEWEVDYRRKRTDPTTN